MDQDTELVENLDFIESLEALEAEGQWEFLEHLEEILFEDEASEPAEGES